VSNAFEVIVLGVGDSFTERHHSTALLLVHGGFFLAIDCPDSYRAVLADAARTCGRDLSLPTIDHVLITHVHGDHMNGLEGVAFFKHFVERKRVRLVASPEVRESIWDARLRAPMDTLWDGQSFRTMTFDDYFEFTPLDWSGPTQVGPFRIRTHRTRHHVPTSALLVEAGGRKLGYSSDTAFDPELIRFLSGADLVIHETNFGPAHTSYADLLTVSPEIRERMYLIHYADQFDLDGSRIRVAREGQVLTV
jgi:ribonuclease BN (tRNA processing enzyme)